LPNISWLMPCNIRIFMVFFLGVFSRWGQLAADLALMRAIINSALALRSACTRAM